MTEFYSGLNVLAIIAAVIGIIFFIFSWFTNSFLGMNKEQLYAAATSLILIAIVIWVGISFNRGNKILEGIF